MLLSQTLFVCPVGLYGWEIVTFLVKATVEELCGVGRWSNIYKTLPLSYPFSSAPFPNANRPTDRPTQGVTAGRCKCCVEIEIMCHPAACPSHCVCVCVCVWGPRDPRSGFVQQVIIMLPHAGALEARSTNCIFSIPFAAQLQLSSNDGEAFWFMAKI